LVEEVEEAPAKKRRNGNPETDHYYFEGDSDEEIEALESRRCQWDTGLTFVSNHSLLTFF